MLTQRCCLWPFWEKPKAPIDRRTCGEEPLADWLNQGWIAHMRSFREQAGCQVSFSVDGKQLIDSTYIALDEISYRLDTLGSNDVSSDHQVEDGIIDQGFNCYQEIGVGSGECSDGCLSFCFKFQALFYCRVQFFDFRRSCPLDFRQSERFFPWYVRGNQILDQGHQCACAVLQFCFFQKSLLLTANCH